MYRKVLKGCFIKLSSISTASFFGMTREIRDQMHRMRENLSTFSFRVFGHECQRYFEVAYLLVLPVAVFLITTMSLLIHGCTSVTCTTFKT